MLRLLKMLLEMAEKLILKNKQKELEAERLPKPKPPQMAERNHQQQLGLHPERNPLEMIPKLMECLKIGNDQQQQNELETKAISKPLEIKEVKPMVTEGLYAGLRCPRPPPLKPSTLKSLKSRQATPPAETFQNNKPKASTLQNTSHAHPPSSPTSSSTSTSTVSHREPLHVLAGAWMFSQALQDVIHQDRRDAILQDQQ